MKFSALSKIVMITSILILFALPSFLVSSTGFLINADGTSYRMPASATGTSTSFGSPVNLGAGFDPNVQNVGSHVYVAWTDKSRGIFFRSSTDDGMTWSSTQKIGSGGNYPIMSANGNYVYLVWSAGGIKFVSSSDYGATWSNPIALSSKAGLTPYVASNGALVSVVYLVPNVGSFVTTSSNSGQTWIAPYQYSNGPEPQVAMSGSNIYAVSDKLDRSHVQLAVSHDSGRDWTVSSLPPGSETWIVASGSNVYAIWETKSPQSVVWFLSSSDYGSTFETKIISTGMPDAWNPMINAIGNTVWVGIQEFGAKSQNWMLTSTNGGATWTSQSVTGLGHVDGFIFNIATTDGTNVYAMWIQASPASKTSAALVAYSTDGGGTWATVKIGQSDRNNDVAIGSISSDGSHGLAAWQFNSTIYFAPS